MKPLRLIPALVPAVAAALLASTAFGFETRAKAAWVYDMTTGSVLLEKDAHRALPPASMSKLMTLYILFEAVRDGRISMDTEFSVSSKARAMGGSTMFLNEQDRPTVEDLIRGIIVNSGNDACVVVAEGLAGSEEAFSRLATERARALGMGDTTLANASGWPHPEHRMSMSDLGILAQHLIEDFPEYYPIFSETHFNYKDRAPANARNRNPLLSLGVGADGLKTGHTAEAGYSLVGSVKQGDRRLIFVISGLDTEVARAEESERITNWAFRQFSLRTIANEKTRVAEAPVFLGEASSVGLIAAENVQVLVPATPGKGVTARVEWQGPLHAPLKAGDQVGELIVSVPDMPDLRSPVLVENDVPKAGFLNRLTTAVSVLGGRAASKLVF
ncbi:D-alanyl-D-alanine carboxypeptidase family protein [Falsigemmobacter faecalis]|uniref:serine-type D-Ala-D-Ala carboxypeptidase n=1 Tax=Falsigemmobacter faecalis TaxID=2488730 RepID=A0A3P3DLJ5_9RHOB|nr:D-alanyl-D-alanine carboxypeptidase family protein [Falsigemmobacter faecalis]RRH73488.1 D-alanyl-D-alanine carboxypeptidase [Falsigemmobacter faecalis]